MWREREKVSTLTRLSFREMDSRFKYFLFVVVIFTLGNSSDMFILLRGQDRGLSILQVMGMALTFNAIYTIFAGPLGALSDQVGRRRLRLSGWIAYGLVLSGIRFLQNRLANLDVVCILRFLLRRHRRHRDCTGCRPRSTSSPWYRLRILQRRDWNYRIDPSH